VAFFLQKEPLSGEEELFAFDRTSRFIGNAKQSLLQWESDHH